MDDVLNVFLIFLALSGGLAWLIVFALLFFYWLCQLPPRD